MKKTYHIGIDIGSTTVKLVALDPQKRVIYKDYKRHFSNTKQTLLELFKEFFKKYGDNNYTISLTGSGAISLSKYLKLNFVQEVIACKNAIETYAPQTSVAI